MKPLIFCIALFISPSWVLSQSESSEETNPLQTLKGQREFAIEAINAKYLKDLEKMKANLTEAKDLEGVKKVEEEILELESQQSLKNKPAREFTENYMIGTKWEFVNEDTKYLMVFERKTYKLFKFDSRGRKFLQLQREWKTEDMGQRRLSTSRGTIPITLNESLTEMSMAGTTAKLVGK